MKKKQLEDLRKKSVSELRKKASKMRKELAETRAKKAVGQEKNVKIVKNLRRDLAQVLTILTEKKKK